LLLLLRRPCCLGVSACQRIHAKPCSLACPCWSKVLTQPSEATPQASIACKATCLPGPKQCVRRLDASSCSSSGIAAQTLPKACVPCCSLAACQQCQQVALLLLLLLLGLLLLLLQGQLALSSCIQLLQWVACEVPQPPELLCSGRRAKLLLLLLLLPLQHEAGRSSLLLRRRPAAHAGSPQVETLAQTLADALA
jgi:hypothetical protein